MFQLPTECLNKLVCKNCDGYLNKKPIWINIENGQQICGKCHTVLSSIEQTYYTRQIGLETIIDYMVFPCKCNLEHCNHNLRQNDQNSYELKTMNDDLNIDLVYNFVNETNLKFDLNLQAGQNKQILVQDKIGNDPQTKINITGLVVLGINPEIVYCKTRMDKPNIYSPITESLLHCNNCKILLLPNEMHHCLFGHVYCKNCKNLECLLCWSFTKGGTRACCKNARKGCQFIDTKEDLKGHEIDCDYNDHVCPFHTCNFLDTLENLKKHLIDGHADKIVVADNFKKIFRRKDETISMYCHDNLFEIYYFFYYTYIEFIVKHLGRNDHAKNYRYEIRLSDKDGKVMKRSADCLGWNGFCLDKSVIFHYDEITKNGKIQFDAHISIISKNVIVFE